MTLYSELAVPHSETLQSIRSTVKNIFVFYAQRDYKLFDKTAFTIAEKIYPLPRTYYRT
jgi:hypothetical protein